MVKRLLVNDLDQVAVDLIELYKDKPLVLIFYNNDCIGCTGRAIPLAYEYHQKYLDVQVIGIHSNFRDNTIGRTAIESIFRNKKVPFPIYIDPNHKLYDTLNCEGTPQWILITKEREIYRSIFGSQAGAQNRLLYALEGLLNETKN